MRPSCKDCIYAVPNFAAPNGGGGGGEMLCHYAPPTAYAVPLPTHQGISMNVVTVRPTVKTSDFCAQFVSNHAPISTRFQS